MYFRLMISGISLALLFTFPSFADDQVLTFPGSNNKTIVCISGDEEYRSEETCPMLTKILNRHHGFTTHSLFSIHPDGYVDPNYQKNIPGLEKLEQADLVIMALRFRELPPEQLKYIANYVKQGKAIIGLRTSTHAFHKKLGKQFDIDWKNFGAEVFGSGWAGHYGKHKIEGARSKINSAKQGHPILNGVDTIFAASDVYGIKTVNSENADILLHGVVTDSLDPDSKPVEGKQLQPLAWLRQYQLANAEKGQSFTTTMGAAMDFNDANLRRLIVNASYHLLDMDVPAKANVELVDAFSPSAYGFIRKEGYFKKKNFNVADYSFGNSPLTGPKSLLPPQPQSTRPSYPQPQQITNEHLQTKLPLTPKQGERIVFLGNALAERMDLYGYFESLLHGYFNDKQITFRNMGRSAFTPGLRPDASNANPWAFPGAEKFHPNFKVHKGQGHFPSADEWLTLAKADTIVAFYGFNESFAGMQGIHNFKQELSAFVEHTLTRTYNLKHAPKLVLATPIPSQPKLDLLLPNHDDRNRLLKAYAEVIKEVANQYDVGFIDIYQPMLAAFEAQPNLTINGVHLNEQGYKTLAPILMSTLFGEQAAKQDINNHLRKVVVDKNWFWRSDFIPLNGVHSYGRRWQPFGDKNYPEEIQKIRQMTELRDQKIWQIAQQLTTDLVVDDSTTLELTPIETNFTKKIEYTNADKAVEHFQLPEGYSVNLFASEAQFPLLENPVQMSFDNQGRLWVAVSPSYPHYKPGDAKPNDKLLILEDTDNDGRADKQTVFADNLHLPIGFSFAPEGVYLAEAGYLVLLQDKDGDGISDHKEYLISGFDQHDSHHSISAFNHDAAGGLFMLEGTFIHSQIETPYGPQRMVNGGVWRFDPNRWALERVSQSGYANPWGLAIDQYGQTFLNDASGGRQHWLLPLSLKLNHGQSNPKIEMFNWEHRVRPTSGSEFLYSAHFPDEVQGDYLYANVIGFLGIKQFQSYENGTGISGKHRQDLIQTNDPNFRPVDLEVAPDGSLYFIDWHNALIGHMQHSARDPNRSSQYGRVYRVTYDHKPLLAIIDVTEQTVAQLLENLKSQQLNLKVRTLRELRSRPRQEVIAAVSKWQQSHLENELYLLNALWVQWGQQQLSNDLIARLLTAKSHQVRAATVRVLRHSLHLIDNPSKWLLLAAEDSHGRVRLEALAAATWLGGQAGANILVEVAKQPIDKWLAKPLNSAMETLGSEIKLAVEQGRLTPQQLPLLTQLLNRNVAVKQQDELAVSRFSDPKLQAQYELGKEVYQREAHCGTCHQEDGKGLTGIYPPLQGSEWVLQSQERLIKIALHGLQGPITVKGVTYSPEKGIPPMMGFGGLLKDNELAAVLTYIRNSWGNKGSSISPEQVQKVRAKTAQQQTFYTEELLLKQHPMEK
ncbi:PVC-type heme-binding CxxCH protein [Paraferrimonas sp. SM1919]|uniref:PVC-type heme-binding CxxCH protein n=1 Tax=Paraferrimonas sp. SM1919 TaxID=2662263 RepID=UPI0013D17B26|nr:PVC-type heme-binding CxxCH protein [Paraferrimonas sp. SM1919]